MKTLTKKSTLTIVILSCLLAVAVASTVILAAFNVQRTSTTTITFAEGLTVELTPKANADIKITADESGQGSGVTFTYTATNGKSLTDNDAPVTLDGINAKLNKTGYIAYRLVLNDNTDTAISGTWGSLSESSPYTVTFTPAGNADWVAVLTLPNNTDWTVTGGSSATLTSGQLTATGSPLAVAIDMFSTLEIKGATTASDVNALAGMTIKTVITLKADTASAPTFS